MADITTPKIRILCCRRPTISGVYISNYKKTHICKVQFISFKQLWRCGQTILSRQSLLWWTSLGEDMKGTGFFISSLQRPCYLIPVLMVVTTTLCCVLRSSHERTRSGDAEDTSVWRILALHPMHLQLNLDGYVYSNNIHAAGAWTDRRYRGGQTTIRWWSGPLALPSTEKNRR